MTRPTCVCCGRPVSPLDASTRPMHIDCWSEHHSSPLPSEQPWPPDHRCAVPDPDDCECVAYTIRTDYGTGTEHDVDDTACPIHDYQRDA